MNSLRQRTVHQWSPQTLRTVNRGCYTLGMVLGGCLVGFGASALLVTCVQSVGGNTVLWHPEFRDKGRIIGGASWALGVVLLFFCYRVNRSSETRVLSSRMSRYHRYKSDTDTSTTSQEAERAAGQGDAEVVAVGTRGSEEPLVPAATSEHSIISHHMTIDSWLNNRSKPQKLAPVKPEDIVLEMTHNNLCSNNNSEASAIAEAAMERPLGGITVVNPKYVELTELETQMSRAQLTHNGICACTSEEHVTRDKKFEECTVVWRAEVTAESMHHHFTDNPSLCAWRAAWIQGSSPGLTPPRHPGAVPVILGESPQSEGGQGESPQLNESAKRSAQDEVDHAAKEEMLKMIQTLDEFNQGLDKYLRTTESDDAMILPTELSFQDAETTTGNITDDEHPAGELDRDPLVDPCSEDPNCTDPIQIFAAVDPEQITPSQVKERSSDLSLSEEFISPHVQPAANGAAGDTHWHPTRASRSEPARPQTPTPPWREPPPLEDPAALGDHTHGACAKTSSLEEVPCPDDIRDSAIKASVVLSSPDVAILPDRESSSSSGFSEGACVADAILLPPSVGHMHTQSESYVGHPTVVHLDTDPASMNSHSGHFTIACRAVNSSCNSNSNSPEKETLDTPLQLKSANMDLLANNNINSNNVNRNNNVFASKSDTYLEHAGVLEVVTSSSGGSFSQNPEVQWQLPVKPKSEDSILLLSPTSDVTCPEFYSVDDEDILTDTSVVDSGDEYQQELSSASSILDSPGVDIPDDLKLTFSEDLD